MNSRRTSNRLERRAERSAKQIGSTPRPYRQRASRTPVKVPSGSGLNWMVIGGVLAAFAVIAVVVYVVLQADNVGDDSVPSHIKAMLDDSTSLPGAYIPPHPGADGEVCASISCLRTSDDRNHFVDGTVWPICTEQQISSKEISGCYTSNPPTSGPHAASPAPLQRVLENPLPKENLIHTMEHGGVILWYNTEDQQLIKQLADIVNEQIDRRKLVTMVRYPGMESNTIALTGWTRLDKFSATDFSKKRVEDFIEKHSKRFNPEDF